MGEVGKGEEWLKKIEMWRKNKWGIETGEGGKVEGENSVRKSSEWRCGSICLEFSLSSNRT